MKNGMEFWGIDPTNENDLATDEITNLPSVSKELDEGHLKYGGMFAEIDDELKKSNGGLGFKEEAEREINQQFPEAPSSDELLLTDIERVEENKTVGWGEIRDGEVVTKINVLGKLWPFVKKSQDFRICVSALKSRAEHGATHRCEFVGKSTSLFQSTSTNPDVIAVITGNAGLNQFAFDLRFANIKRYLYKDVKGRVWFKFKAQYKNNSVVVTAL